MYNSRWTLINNQENVNLFAKDVVAVHDSLHIVFNNLANHVESVYTAHDNETGDGIECFIGHKSLQIFAFAEKTSLPRIFLMTYPEFKIMTILQDDECRYGALELTEAEQIISLTNYPDCKITIWCWRTHKKLMCCNTGVQYYTHVLKSSLSSGQFCHFWNRKICIWEIIPSYKTCLLQRKPLYKDTTDFNDVIWTNDGLFAIDAEANIYSISSDGLHMTSKKEWTHNEEIFNPLLSFNMNDIIVYGSNNVLFYIKKSHKSLVTTFKFNCKYDILNIQSSYFNHTIICTTKQGDLIKLTCNENMKISVVSHSERNIMYFDIINPTAEELVTLSSENILCLWGIIDRKLKAKLHVKNQIYSLSSYPNGPLIVMSCGCDEKYGISLLRIENHNIKYLSSKCLTNQMIDKVEWMGKCTKMLASTITGQFFYIQINKSYELEVKFFMEFNDLVNSIIFTLDNNEYLLATLQIDKKDELKCFDVSNKKEYSVNFINLNEIDLISYINNFNAILGISVDKKELSTYMFNIKGNTVNLSQSNSYKFNGEIKGVFIIHNSNKVAFYDYSKIYILELPSLINVNQLNMCHRFGEGILDIKISLECKIIAGLSNLKNFVVYADKRIMRSEKIITYEDDRILLTELEKFLVDDNETWIDQLDSDEKIKETSEWAEVRLEILKKYELIKQQLKCLLDDNISAPKLHQLPLLTFRLNTDDQERILETAVEERESEKAKIESKIQAQDKVTDWIKATCWDPVEVVGTELHSIFTNKFIENYALLPENSDGRQTICLEILKALETVEDANLIKSWKILFNENRFETEEYQPITSPVLYPLNYEEYTSDGDGGENSDYDEAYSNELSGSTTYQFIRPLKPTCSQMLLQSFMQMNWDALKTKKTTRLLESYFNKYFDKMMELKKKEVTTAKERCNRLRLIISELNILRKLKGSKEVIEFRLEEPQWVQEEIPIQLTKVESDEVSVLPYVNPSDIMIVKEEKIVVNPLYEAALINMMDGTLEKLWHEEVKKDIPKPICMLEKDVEDLNETDMCEIEAWKEKMVQREKDREKYGNMLYREFFKLSDSYNDGIKNFNKKYGEMYSLKLKVESVIAQEEFKHMLLRMNCLSRIEAVEKLKELELELSEIEAEQEHVSTEIHVIQGQLSECHTAYEILVQRDKGLDKNFKTNFSDVSKIVKGLCYKLFKKRPKWVAKPGMTVGVLNEMAQTCLIKERPQFLHVDCHDYLRGMDQMDSMSNMPPVMDEATWVTMCKLRRNKIENEIKIRAATTEISDVEAAYSAWQKRQVALKSFYQKLKNDINHHRMFMETQTKNRMLQLVMKSGFVEVETTGHLDDFKDAVLIKQEDIEVINSQIRDARNIKDKSERATLKFKKRILSKEWEHATLKMKVKQLQGELYYFERIKVTKEIQDYIHRKSNMRDDGEDIEKKSKKTRELFEKQLLDRIQRVEELEMNIGCLRGKIKNVDTLIHGLKKEITKQRTSDEVKNSEKIMQSISGRLNIIAWRNKLLSQIQKQRSAIVLLQTELELQRLKTYPTLAFYQQQH